MRAAPWWGAVAAALGIAVAAGIGDWRRRRRRDLDRIGPFDWPTMQILALIAAGVLAVVALNA